MRNRSNNSRLLVAAFGLAAVLVSGRVIAAPAAAPKAAAKPSEKVADESAVSFDEDIQHIEVLRRELSAGKADVIAQSVTFTSPEQEAAFWKLYRRYESELAELSDSRVGLIKEYVGTGGTLKDDQAKSFLKRAFDGEEASLALRRKYAEEISSEISPVVAGLFTQVEGYIHRYTLLQIESALPAVQALSDK